MLNHAGLANFEEKKRGRFAYFEGGKAGRFAYDVEPALSPLINGN
jgi:hypothetical protein